MKTITVHGCSLVFNSDTESSGTPKEQAQFMVEAVSYMIAMNPDLGMKLIGPDEYADIEVVDDD